MDAFCQFHFSYSNFSPSANWKEILAREIELVYDSLKKKEFHFYLKNFKQKLNQITKKNTENFFHFVLVTNYKSHAFQ